MRGMEEEAYKVGNLCFRDWEDNVKSGKIRISIPLKESLLREKEEKYTIVSGDTLSRIAGDKYGDVHMWPIIYKVNKDIIGEYPDMISPGTEIVIPDESQFDELEDDELNSIYSLSNYYINTGDTWMGVPGGRLEKLDINPEIFANSGRASQNAITEYGIWKGKKETHPDVQPRLAAMWANIGWRRWSPTETAWSAAAVSWFFRFDPDFPRGSGHQIYVNAAKRNRRAGTPGYQHFTPEELNYEYIEDDIIGYIPRSYGKTHCDVYIGNGRCIGGNLNNTVTLNRVINNRVSGEKIILVLRKVEDRNLQEWKNEELNRLLLEKFNLGDNKNET